MGLDFPGSMNFHFSRKTSLKWDRFSRWESHLTWGIQEKQ